jgi:hypothetical protein
MNTKHEEKHCPRCGAGFECKAGTIHLCQCSVVPLNEEERFYIKTKFEDCLCASCLAELKIEFGREVGSNYTASLQPPAFIHTLIHAVENRETP